MDKASKTEDKKWKSILKSGTLTRNPDTRKYSISWDDTVTEILSTYNDGSRGMELSELANFNDQLLTFDDRTGIVYFVEGGKVIPKHIIMDGNGHVDKGLKIEWATVKDSHLYVGSTGKEWTTTKGEFVNNNPQWIARIDSEGRIERLDWGQHYTALRKETGTLYPGYLLHEAIRLNAALRRWFFLPRRVSTEGYDEALDESRGSNTVISMNEQFSDIRVSHIGENKPTHGFASFQFVPFREHEVVALKTEEHQDTISTYITVFDLDGRVLMDETYIGPVKFEGIEIL
jgi:soluble calcium-activated nucleotidase 1